jgi:glutaredoxin
MTIQIYSKNNCVYCDKAKALVKGLGMTYEEKVFGKDFTSDAEELYRRYW